MPPPLLVDEVPRRDQVWRLASHHINRRPGFRTVLQPMAVLQEELRDWLRSRSHLPQFIEFLFFIHAKISSSPF